MPTTNGEMPLAEAWLDNDPPPRPGVREIRLGAAVISTLADGSVDEIVIPGIGGCSLHLEKMDDHNFFVGVYGGDAQMRINFFGNKDGLVGHLQTDEPEPDGDDVT